MAVILKGIWELVTWIMIFAGIDLSAVATSFWDVTSSSHFSSAPPACEEETGFLGDRMFKNYMARRILSQLTELPRECLCGIEE